MDSYTPMTLEEIQAKPDGLTIIFIFLLIAGIAISACIEEDRWQR